MENFELAQLKNQGAAIEKALRIAFILKTLTHADVDSDDETPERVILKDLILKARSIEKEVTDLLSK